MRSFKKARSFTVLLLLILGFGVCSGRLHQQNSLTHICALNMNVKVIRYMIFFWRLTKLAKTFINGRTIYGAGYHRVFGLFWLGHPPKNRPRNIAEMHSYPSDRIALSRRPSKTSQQWVESFARARAERINTDWIIRFGFSQNLIMQSRKAHKNVQRKWTIIIKLYVKYYIKVIIIILIIIINHITINNHFIETNKIIITLLLLLIVYIIVFNSSLHETDIKTISNT